MPKAFVKNDSGFICAHCGRTVEKLSYTSRNHCPYCLHSLHVDIHPGDRANPCGGDLQPVGLETKGKKGYVLVFRCARCGEIRRNKTALDDDYQLLVRLSAHEELD